MEKKDLLKVYACCGALWSSFKLPKGQVEAKIFDEVWFSVLKNFKTELVLIALREYASENEFCNVAKVGALCEKLQAKMNGTYADEESVVDEILGALTYNSSECKTRFAKLTPLAKDIVRYPEFLTSWANCDKESLGKNLRKTARRILDEKKTMKTCAELKLACGTEETKLIED